MFAILLDKSPGRQIGSNSAIRALIKMDCLLCSSNGFLGKRLCRVLSILVTDPWLRPTKWKVDCTVNATEFKFVSTFQVNQVK